MTCPDLDRLVDDAVAGLPGAQARLDAHADACAACLAEADCEHAPIPELAMLADAVCPPDVLAAALAAVAHGTKDRSAAPARGASDRPAERSVSRPAARTVWTHRIAAGIAFAAALLVLRAAWPEARPETPQVATTPDATSPPRPLGTDGGTTPQPVEIAAVPQPASPQIAAPIAVQPIAVQPVAPRAAVTRPTPHTARPTRVLDPTPDPTPVVVPQTTETVAPDADVASVSPADSIAARSDLLLALAIVGRAQRTADDAVSAEMRRVSDALEPARTL